MEWMRRPGPGQENAGTIAQRLKKGTNAGNEWRNRLEPGVTDKRTGTDAPETLAHCSFADPEAKWAL